MSDIDQVLARLPQSVCDAVKLRLPELKTCKPHAGKFSLEELKKSGLPAPAVLISTLGAKPGVTRSDAAHSFVLSMAAYVVTRDGLGAPRDLAAANICQALLTLIPGKRWGEPALGAAQGVHMHTLVSSGAKDITSSLWAVTWGQPVTFHTVEAAPLGAELYVAQSPAIGTDNVTGYTQVGEPTS
ncbi:hypothetical protein EBB79_08265 [Parasedimentitalea marina]|uniref:Uncharacterized protein n=1 Tax=Parasedimentitalea marina TaxID=2483033 RepID=A0A3T0N1J2_9RHOB|nr:hypothetical protein [Parasedimentitalea marina]AZV77890.1 hypothetical protein EBB79_08265 [Parasedimentitalea marina]